MDKMEKKGKSRPENVTSPALAVCLFVVVCCLAVPFFAHLLNSFSLCRFNFSPFQSTLFCCPTLTAGTVWGLH